MFTALPSLALAGTPLGSPKPPVCTLCGARAIVGAAELPVENTLVLPSCFGMTGGGCGLFGGAARCGCRSFFRFGLRLRRGPTQRLGRAVNTSRDHGFLH